EPPGSGNYVREGFTSEKGCNVAVDGAGGVFDATPVGKVFTEKQNGEKSYIDGIEKLESITAIKSKSVDLEGVTMPIEPGSEDVYSDRLNSVVEYNSTGKRLGSFGEGVLESSRALTTNASGSAVYVATATKVKVFGPRVLLPEVEIESPTEVTTTSILLRGWI